MNQVVWTIIGRGNRSNNPFRREFEHLMTSIVDICDVLFDSLDDDAHCALTGLLARRNVNVVSIHQLVDRVTIDVDLWVCNQKLKR